MPEPKEMVLEVKFAGEQLNLHGIPIYELGTAFVSIQRMVHKAYLAQEERWERGRSPTRKEKEMLALQIGERRLSSDWFGLLPVLADPATLLVIRQTVDYVIGGLKAYAIGLDRTRSESNESREMFIGAIYADTVNIVNRIGNVGVCESIEISSPTVRHSETITFDVSSRNYVRDLEAGSYLGNAQTIEGDVFKLYPGRAIIEILRPGGRKCKVFLEPDNFDLVRFSQTHSARIKVTGRPRFRIGAGMRTFSEFEGHSVVLLDEEE